MSLFKAIENILGKKILRHSSVSGGDINQAYLVETTSDKFFVKANGAPFALSMFKAEVEGLAAIAATNTIRVPDVLDCGESEEGAFLLMEYVEVGAARQSSWKELGESLASLHMNHADLFGFPTDNFIGSLPQSNSTHDNWLNFYKKERIDPQLDLAYRRNRLSNSTFAQVEEIFGSAAQIFPEEKPSLIHGDLWNGNFLFDQKGIPCLIDPAVAYAHREMDLAMSRLFGGFHSDFYEAYHKTYPLKPGFEDRMELYQLYYLLVHVNLFGGSYIQSVQQILDKFSS